jgi:hypothetical protein
MAAAVPAAIVGGSLISGVFASKGAKSSSKAAGKAADAQVQAASIAADTQLEMYGQSREDLAPWREAGQRSLADLEKIQGQYASVVRDPNLYTQSPAYNWLQEQGISAIDRSASAAGKLDSGQHSKDLLRYNQGLALGDYTGYLGRLESLMNRYAGTAQVGQTASGTLANLGQQTGANVGNAYLAAGNAMAGGEINQANARTGLYQNLSNIGTNATNQFMLNNYLQMNQPTTQPSTNSSIPWNEQWGGM